MFKKDTTGEPSASLGKLHTSWTGVDRYNAVEQRWPCREPLNFDEPDYSALLYEPGDDFGDFRRQE